MVFQEKEEQYEVQLKRILGFNRPEWPHIIVSCLAATAVGCTLPVFAVLFGEVIGVSTVKKLVIVSTHHESSQKKKNK
jgi:ATP-binding cassette subfamily B (MDR/TAP) protein 1